MDDKGRRMVKERIKGQGEERTHNVYYGIDESILFNGEMMEVIMYSKLKEMILSVGGIKKVKR